VVQVSLKIDVTDIDFSKSLELRSEKHTKVAKMESFTDNSKSLLLKFDISNSIEDSLKLIGYDVFCNTFESRKNIPDLTGYLVSDVNGNDWGRVENTDLKGLNKMIEVNNAGRVILIPYHESLLEDIDTLKKKITIDPPDGLKDLN